MLTSPILAPNVGRMPAKINLPDELLEQRRAIGARIRALRTERGWSQEQLAERTTIDRQTIYRIELGTMNSGINTYLLAAAAFGVPLRDLMP